MFGEVNCKFCMKLSIVRNFSVSAILFSKKSHYQALGISKSATQADVKSAYYELSKIYHPDLNTTRDGKKNTENARKFRDITEAYEILGNVKKRKLYDKGFDMGSHSYSPADSASATDIHHQKFYNSRESRTRPPPPTGRSTVYNFDEWTRMHYGATMKARQDMKRRHNMRVKMMEEQNETAKSERYFLVVIAIFALSLGVMTKLEHDYYDYVKENDITDREKSTNS